MEFRKNLLNRIHGWFPQDTQVNICKSNAVRKNNQRQHPLTIPAQATRSASKNAAFSCCLYVVGYGVVFYFSLKWNLSFYQTAALAITSLVTGIMLCWWGIKSTLKKLKKTYRFSGFNIKEMGAAFTATGLSVLFGYFMSTGFQISFVEAAVISIYFSSSAYMAINPIALWFFEKEEGMRIMQGWFDPELIVIPKPPPE